jgi:hypothetical protein
MFKKIIINIAIVAIVVFAFDFAIGRTLRYFYFKETSGLHYRTTYAMDSTKADILIFGSSRANHHYVPEIYEDSLKMTFYNSGRDGNGIFFQTAVLKSALKRYTPKVIILDFAGDIEKEKQSYGRISSLLPYYWKHEEIRKTVELRSPFEKIKLLSEIYPFNSEILTIAIGNLEINKKRKHDNKGYVALYKEWKEGIDSITNNKMYDEADSNKVNAFREFLVLAKESGANVFVVYSPIFLKFNQLQEINICRALCSAENVIFWDFSKDTLFLNNRQFFQDIGHLNNNGAIIFSNLMVDKIKDYINEEKH